MTEQSIKALNFNVQEVGKHVKASKKRYQWTLSLKGKIHTITLDYSFISGKVKVVVDKKTLLQNQLPPNVSFQYPFTLDGYSMNCIQQGQNFQLRCNNKVFSHLYNQEKTTAAFRNYEDEIKDIKTDTSKFSASGKTFKINVGGVQGKKKSTVKVQSQNWGDFGGDSFPSYFSQSSNSSFGVQQAKQAPKKSNLLDDDQQPVNINSKIHNRVAQQKKQSILNFNNQVQKSNNNSKSTDFFSFDEINFSKSAPSNNIGASSPNSEQLHNMTGFSKGKAGAFFEMGATVQNNSGNLLGYQQPQISSNSLLIDKNMNNDEFNTMQKMFATMQVQENANSKGINFFDINEKPNPALTLQKTVNMTQNANQTNNNMNASNFNSMQHLFMNQQNVQIQQNFNNQHKANQISNINNANVNLNDYNSMQLLFQTNNINSGFNLESNPTASKNTQFTSKIDPNNSDDIFKSMGIELTKEKGNQENNNMFNTVSNPGSMQKKQNSNDWF